MREKAMTHLPNEPIEWSEPFLHVATIVSVPLEVVECRLFRGAPEAAVASGPLASKPPG